MTHTTRSAQPDRRPSASPPTPTRSCCAPRAPADLETPIGAFLRLDDGGAGLPARVGRGRRAARPLLVPRRRPAAAARGPRRPGPHPDPAGHGRRVRPGPADRRRPTAPDPLAALRAFVPRRRVQPTEGMPRFTGGAVGALAYDAVSIVRADACRCPSATRSASPTAAFIETDLVLVFDHLTHTLSAIASLHTEAPDLEGRYRIAEAAIFEALERTARPERRRARRRRARRAPRHRQPRLRRRPDRRRASAATSTSTRSRSPRTRSRPARRSRSCSPAASRSTCRSTRRPARPLDGIGLYRALRRVNPSPYLFFVRTPDVRGRRRLPGAARSRSRATSSRPTRSPARGRAAPTPREDALLAEQLQRDPKERAEHVMLVDLGRNDLGRVAAAGHGDRQQVHGGRALQPRPPPRVARRGPAPAGARRARRAAGGVPGRHALGRARRSGRCS